MLKAIGLSLFMAACTAFPVTGRAQDISAERTPQFVELRADQVSYGIGARAVLNAYIDILPGNPNDEIALEATFAGEPIKVVRISDTQAVSITPTFPAAGSYSWVVDVFIQDRRAAAEYLATIAFYENEIHGLQSELSSETDPARKAQLSSQIDRDMRIIALAKGELSSLRRKVGTQTLSVTVTDARGTEKRSQANTLALSLASVMYVQADRDPADYLVGDTASFDAHVLTSFNGVDGPQEVVVRGAIDGARIGGNESGPGEFIFSSPELAQGDVGAHSFKASLFIRSKAKADSLRDAIAKALAWRAARQVELDQTTDPAIRASLETKINDSTSVINVLYAQLEGLLAPVEEQTVSFEVSAVPTLWSRQ